MHHALHAHTSGRWHGAAKPREGWRLERPRLAARLNQPTCPVWHGISIHIEIKQTRRSCDARMESLSIYRSSKHGCVGRAMLAHKPRLEPLSDLTLRRTCDCTCNCRLCCMLCSQGRASWRSCPGSCVCQPATCHRVSSLTNLVGGQRAHQEVRITNW